MGIIIPIIIDIIPHIALFVNMPTREDDDRQKLYNMYTDNDIVDLAVDFYSGNYGFLVNAHRLGKIK